MADGEDKMYIVIITDDSACMYHDARNVCYSYDLARVRFLCWYGPPPPLPTGANRNLSGILLYYAQVR